MKSVYVCNVSSEETPMQLPEVNFGEAKENQKPKNGNSIGRVCSANTAGEEPLALPSMNFNKD